MKKTGLYEYVHDFSVDSDSTDVDYILDDIHEYLMKKHDIKCLHLFLKCLLDYFALAQYDVLVSHLALFLKDL